MLDSPQVSVVIPTYNRAQYLCAILPSYLNSRPVREVIIVDDASTDDTYAKIQEMMSVDQRIQYLRNGRNCGAPASRNVGAAYACSEWILESEDDLELGEHCLETLVAHAQLKGAGIIAGRRVWMRLGETPQAALTRATRNRKPPFNERLLDHNSHAVTTDDIDSPLVDGTMLIRCEVFHQVQYYELYGGQSSWREESDFQLSALEQGFKVVFCPHAVTFHHSRASQSFGKNRWKGTAVYAYRVYWNNLTFLRRHQDYLRRNLPKSLLLGSPLATALVYGAYRAAWLMTVETIRKWRNRKRAAFTWE
jgi:GT2 family glycosyltransferase